MAKLTPCFLFDILTPKKFVLQGLWFGPEKPQRIIIFVHGLGSSALHTALARSFADKDTAVITFNNRGHDTVSKLYKFDSKRNKHRSLPAGKAHEVFTECVDDIEGAVEFARNNGVHSIYLAGHSTGCQKSMYYASRKNNQSKIAGIILLAPLSDYAIALFNDTDGVLAKATDVAHALVQKGRKHELLPASASVGVIDAQRFLSLNTANSAEEIFSYVQPKKNPRVFKSIKIPVLTVLGGADEYSDRPAQDISSWFTLHTQSSHFMIKIISGASHGFTGKERAVSSVINKWFQN